MIGVLVQRRTGREVNLRSNGFLVIHTALGVVAEKNGERVVGCLFRGTGNFLNRINHVLHVVHLRNGLLVVCHSVIRD